MGTTRVIKPLTIYKKPTTVFKGYETAQLRTHYENVVIDPVLPELVFYEGEGKHFNFRHGRNLCVYHQLHHSMNKLQSAMIKALKNYVQFIRGRDGKVFDRVILYGTFRHIYLRNKCGCPIDKQPFSRIFVRTQITRYFHIDMRRALVDYLREKFGVTNEEINPTSTYYQFYKDNLALIKHTSNIINTRFGLFLFFSNRRTA